MAKLSPFAADRVRFERIARSYQEKADACPIVSNDRGQDSLGS
jgi:hypothetical protein